MFRVQITAGSTVFLFFFVFLRNYVEKSKLYTPKKAFRKKLIKRNILNECYWEFRSFSIIKSGHAEYRRIFYDMNWKWTKDPQIPLVR